MAPRVKKTCQPKKKVLFDPTDNEMENKKKNLKNAEQKEQEHNKEQSTGKHKENKTSGSELLSPQLKPKMILKPPGFWSKKLQDLEESISNKKCELYEFSGTDESVSFQTKSKKTKQKAKLKRKKPARVPFYKPLNQVKKVIEKKIKQDHSQSMCREQIMLTKERKKLADTGKKFTFSTGMASLGITSTPAAKKDNLVGASNFLFLSPIIVEETEHVRQLNKCSPLQPKDVKNNTLTKQLEQEASKAQNNSVTKHLGQVTPKAETKLRRISCRRVLRSGKEIKI